MDAKVVVTADKAGNVITRSQNNPDFGHIRVEQTRMLIDDNGFARMKKLSALIPGSVEELKAFGWGAGEEVQGKVVVKERLTPFNAKDPERDLKIAGASGIVCTKDGAPIYRKHIFTFNVEQEDETVEHDNQEEIKSAYAEEKESAIKPSEDFNL